MRNVVRSLAASRTTRAVVLLAAFGLLGLGLYATVASGGPTLPPPVITSGPSNPTSSQSATFTYSEAPGSGPAPVSFDCSLDGAVTSIACGSGAAGRKSYARLAQGDHTFRVAVVIGGSMSAQAQYRWTILGLVSFTIAGSPPAGVLLYPAGPDVPIDLVVTNPNSSPITVTAVTTTVTGTSASGCGAANFSVSRQLTANPVIPANATASLSDLGIPSSQWPQLRMLDTRNQDACKHATVNLSFEGTAQGGNPPPPPPPPPPGVCDYPSHWSPSLPCRWPLTP